MLHGDCELRRFVVDGAVPSIVTLTPPYPSGADSLAFSLGDETPVDDMGSESGCVVSNRS